MRFALRFARALTMRPRPASRTGDEMHEDFRSEGAAITAQRGEVFSYGFRPNAFGAKPDVSLCDPLGGLNGADVGFDAEFDSGTEYGYNGP